MIIDTFNKMIDQSPDVGLKDGASWWFDREHQRQYVFNIAAGMIIHHDVEADYAIETAEKLVQQYYERHIQPSTRIK